MKTLTRDLILETRRGKSLPRVLINDRMRRMPEITGRILDLASGNRRPSYFRFLPVSQKAKITSVDISTERQPDIIADLEQKFPFGDSEFDYVFCFNLLEHIFDHCHVISEAARVLKPGGRLLGTVPFLGSVHADPDDYFRYTKSTLSRLFLAAGFSRVKIEALGYGPFCVGYYMVAFLLPGIIRPLFLSLAIGLDKIVRWLRPKHGPQKYVLMYYFTCQK
ncbi:MAG: hypothetical protein COU85_01635 [Candidatus Portnoybacteria bacterium CG10_big_fil_rev_8_21_14_0_10_44_7]|uniref:Methyltransferase type 11 domain-containing protein n=1 Tax=Candidatus Portnoybacteria bacterium CG10_big_fil_rev_8_21_14_0_10_44_7 TaxID=1974816 RepID=A0A2M8KIT9_9BACT|nr:MAG: hypothetical protein COU85_01635 [Candidatus Portnoybacteria bacterium CG10_big_fil_rev_8_21_14_0_10_44_7]